MMMHGRMVVSIKIVDPASLNSLFAYCSARNFCPLLSGSTSVCIVCSVVLHAKPTAESLRC